MVVLVPCTQLAHKWRGLGRGCGRGRGRYVNTIGQLDQPLSDVVQYFGTSVGFYFLWLEFYTKSLLYPAVLGKAPSPPPNPLYPLSCLRCSRGCCLLMRQV